MLPGNLFIPTGSTSHGCARDSDASRDRAGSIGSIQSAVDKYRINVHSFSDYTIHTHRFLNPRTPNENLYIFKIHIVVDEANIDFYM